MREEAAPRIGNAAQREPRDGSGHFRPRTRSGWVALVLFLALFALGQPPIVTGPANRIDPWLLGFPFLYTYLLLVYVAQIAVLLWAWRRGL